MNHGFEILVEDGEVGRGERCDWAVTVEDLTPQQLLVAHHKWQATFGQILDCTIETTALSSLVSGTVKPLRDTPAGTKVKVSSFATYLQDIAVIKRAAFKEVRAHVMITGDLQERQSQAKPQHCIFDVERIVNAWLLSTSLVDELTISEVIMAGGYSEGDGITSDDGPGWIISFEDFASVGWPGVLDLAGSLGKQLKLTYVYVSALAESLIMKRIEEESPNGDENYVRD